MTSRDGAPNEIRLPPLAQAFALPPSTYMTLPPIYNLLSQRNSNAIQGSQAGGEEDAEMVYNAPQEPIDYPKRYQQLIEYIKDTKTVIRYLFLMKHALMHCVNR